ncbi:hypothetical protein LOTGIDRAFT_168805 [Lottia gigantea]|uniref:Sema domain-containing protein n=1 Tax=Lottia gigantea TaxID=225164 RepID=V3ZPG7_LOTGI|nr:hypothetical protein LOTGIDRAFT_168805 [Lottia gigantea]ESO84360.1 hypothetical protein LOTGIDRAFT_168805 [Lottia gigantea]
MEGGIRLQLFLLVSLICHTQCIKILHSFRDPGGNILQKLVIDDQTGNVFLGALNRLHKLDPDLNIVQSASTGPRLDNVECPPPLLPCDKPKTQLNSQIKGLVIDSASNSLILCSSLFHGSCQTLALNNITNVKKFFHKPLVPNDHHSCYMFLAPSINNTQALYIATAYSDLGDAAYRDLVPSISSRSLDNLDFIHRDTEGSTKLEILKEYRESFIVRQLYGFQNGGFVYFITLQRENPGSQKIVSRINRLCQQDRYFRSFVEIPIKCQKSDSDSYDVVQNAYFTNGKLYVIFSNTVSSAGAKKSTFCEYDIQDIDLEFNETVRNCYKAVGNFGPEHYKKIEPCPPLIFGSVDFCGESGEWKDYSAIEGSKPISATPLHFFTSDKPTAIFVHPEGNHRYAYIGTQDGHVIKLRFENGQVNQLFKITHSVGDIILQITNHPQSNLLYILGSHKLSVLSLNHCDDLTSCDECMNDGDETCGWCVMDNRCTTKELCQSSVITPPWLSRTDQSCASISSLQPSSLSYKKFINGGDSRQIKFQVNKLKFESNRNLNCLFINGEKHDNTMAILDQKENTITCPLPRQLPTIPQGKDHEDLELQFHVEGKMIVKRDVSVFDCQGNNNCTSCSTSQFNCHWCPVSHSCVEQSESCPQGDSIKVNDRCPRLETAASDTDILVHSGELKTISVQVRALEANQRSNLKCHFDLSGQVQTVSAKISSSTLTCETIKLAYADDIPYIVAGFKVTWGQQNHPLDNPQRMNVRIYKCASMVTNCGKCLSLDVEYECGWCEDQCSLQKKCQKSWLDQSETCPNPQILRYSPSKGPVKGKTEIQVNGINLGKEISDILGQVTVAGLPCDVMQEHYEPSSSFKCEVKGVTSAKSGTVKVVVNNKYTAESDTVFEFVDPVLNHVDPKQGLMSGGTRVLIKGNNLDVGSDTQVIVGGNSVPVIK